MTPEEKARQNIDLQLAECGWILQDMSDMNIMAGQGVAVREFQLTTGEADYGLYIDGKVAGVIEAKKEGFPLTGVETQNAKYANGLPEGIPHHGIPLPFAYESTGLITRFTNRLDPEPRSREVFSFHRPEELKRLLALGHENQLRSRLQNMPALEEGKLWDIQIRAIERFEKSFAENRPRSLIQMATGSGKTFTAVSLLYRLIKFAGAERILFLVDRNNLGTQTEDEFQAYQSPYVNYTFTEEFGVQRLKGNTISKSARVVITTIQRLYSMLKDEEEFDASREDESAYESASPLVKEALPVVYNPNIPIGTFDFIVIDECHRSIYNQWRQVLDYFDAFLIGLTATPTKQTIGFFNGNLVEEYGHEAAVTEHDEFEKAAGATIPEVANQLLQSTDPDHVGEASRLLLGEADPQQRRDAASTLDINFFDRTEPIAEGTGNLPHLTQEGVAYFVTFRLADSLPQSKLAELKAERDAWLAEHPKPHDPPTQREYYQRFVERVDQWLDAGSGDCILNDPDVRQVVASAFHHFAGERYLLGPFVIMPNHVHIIFAPIGEHQLHNIMHSWKSFTAKQINKHLTRTGTVWQKESFDHIIRSPDEYENKAHYIIDNPRYLQKGQYTLGIHVEEASRLLPNNPDLFKEATATYEIASNESGGTPLLQQAEQNLMRDALRPFHNAPVRELLMRIEEQIIDESTPDILPSAGPNAQSQEKAQSLISDFRQFIEDNKNEIEAISILYSRPHSAVETRLTKKWRVEAASRRLVAQKNPDKTRRDAASTYEPASELLARILRERRQRWEQQQLATYESKGKKPPKNWQSKYKEPAAPDTANLPELPSGPNMRPYLRAANVFEDRIDIDDVKSMNFTPDEFERYKLSYGDILLNEGQSLELIGRPAMYRDEAPGACFTNTLVRFRVYDGLDRDFAMKVFLAYLKNQRFQKIASITVNLAHLGAGRFAELEFPLPPVDEQAEIVRVVEEQRVHDYGRAFLKSAFEGKLTESGVCVP